MPLLPPFATDSRISGTNFNSAFNMVKSGRMPLGGPVWDPESVQMLADWKANNFEEGPRPNPDE